MDTFPANVPAPVFRSPNPPRRSAAAAAAQAVLDPLYFNPTPAKAAAAAAASAAAADAPVKLRPLRSRAARRARQERYKTQPVTFQEIQEVDEEVSPRCGIATPQAQPQMATKDVGCEQAAPSSKFDFLAPPSPTPIGLTVPGAASAVGGGLQSKSMETLSVKNG